MRNIWMLIIALAVGLSACGDNRSDAQIAAQALRGFEELCAASRRGAPNLDDAAFASYCSCTAKASVAAVDATALRRFVAAQPWTDAEREKLREVGVECMKEAAGD
jgi:hypothetical protein